MKDTAYECGMVPQGEAQPRFSVKFYLVAMLFILFDLEIVFMYPWAVVYKEAIEHAHFLEHAQFHLHPDGGIRLRAEKRRARLEEIGASARKIDIVDYWEFPTCAGRWNRLIPLASMIHHIVLYKLKPEVTPARVEEMMMNTRMQLLKIPEVLSIKCGKRIDPELPWPFFIAIDFESMDKFAIFREDPIFVKFTEEIVKPNTSDSLSLDFEMDPGKDVRFS